MSEPLHPRPQLSRAYWSDLSGPWGFAHDDVIVQVQHNRGDVPEEAS